MLTNYDMKASGSLNSSHSVTLVPRLEYSVGLLSEITSILSQRQDELVASNSDITDMQDPRQIRSLDLEKEISCCHEAITIVRHQVSEISDLRGFPAVLPPIISTIRTISAQIHGIIPDCSKMLSEVSVHLGSIALDSASLTKSRFDFVKSNKESAEMLDEVRLTIDTRMNRRYGDAWTGYSAKTANT